MAMPIVFIPGLGCTADLFADQIAALGAGRAIVVADHRSHDALGPMADAILAAAPDRFVLAGLSMGGYAAFEILRRAPDRVTGLVLMDTSARPDTEEARERRLRQIALAEAGRTAEILDLQIPMLIPADRLADAALVARIRRMSEENGPAAFVRQQRAIMARSDSRPTLGAVRCPALVIVGDRDAITPPEVAREIADGVDGATLAVMPACGHLSSIERPAAVTHALTDFLARHDL